MENRLFLNPKPVIVMACMTILAASCAGNPFSRQSALIAKAKQNPSNLLVVDCLLPPQVRNVGLEMTYLAPSEPLRTTALDCGMRGGEYTRYDQANAATALKVWLAKAETGNAEAQTNVGEVYEKGLGTAPDYARAAEWYRKAAAQGFTRAQVNLGYLYEQGLGVPKDRSLAVNWYRKAGGLKDDLALVSQFQATQDTRVAQAQSEIGALKGELSRSHDEIDRLRAEVAEARRRLEDERSRLNRSQNELDDARSQAQRVQPSAAPAARPAPTRSQEDLQAKEAQARRQDAALRKLEEQYQRQNQELLAKLEKAERRTGSLGSELERNRLESARLQARLGQTESELTQVKRAYADRPSASAPPAPSPETTARLDELESRLQQRERELESQRSGAMELNRELQRLTAEKSALEARMSGGIDTRNESLKTLARQLTEATQQQAREMGKVAELERANAKLLAEKRQLLGEKEALASAQQRLSPETAGRLNDLETRLQQRERDLESQRTDALALNREIQRLTAEKSALEARMGSDIGTRNESLKAIARQLTEATHQQANQMDRAAELERANAKLLEEKRQLLAEQEKTAVTQQQMRGQGDLERQQLAEQIKKLEAERSQLLTRIDETGRKLAAAEAAGGNAAPGDAARDSVVATRGSGVSTAGAAPRGLVDVDYGEYYALVIGNSRYEHMHSLETPVNDAKAVADLLQGKYGFKVTVLTDANRYQILTALNELRSKITEKDNFLLYYAGHGDLDRVNQRAQWLPVDAEPGNTANWIATDAVTDLLNQMSARHIFVVADSCYSGVMTRNSLADLKPGISEEVKMKWIRKMLSSKSRTILTSGSNEPVLDVGSNGHSIFAKAFLDALNANNQIYMGQDLYKSVLPAVQTAADRYRAKQSPLYAPIRHTDHETSDFFFVPRSVVAMR